ncbi:MAG: hypothetical protein ACK526_07420 [Planctomyces sp.]
MDRQIVYWSAGSQNHDSSAFRGDENDDPGEWNSASAGRITI